VEAKLGVATAPGGKHATMGTHNRLLKLDAGRYLEVIAIDPQASAPARPRWFALDTPAMRERLARGPALIHWVERTDDIGLELAGYPDDVEVLQFSRGPYRWRLAVPRDGRLPADGAAPTLIQWEGSLHPWASLPDSGCSLASFNATQGALSAGISTAAGLRTLP